MKRFLYISFAIVTLAWLISCQKIEETRVNGQSREVVIEGEIQDADTQAKGLALVALPDWRNTAEENIHLYEDGIEGAKPKMTISSESNRVAYFTASFESIFGAEENSYFTYTGVIAKSNDGFFRVPAVQSPDEISLIDPEADFLIGGPKMAPSQDQYAKFKLDFKRPVSMFRLCFVNLPRKEKVQEIILTTDTPLTGECTLDDIYFDKGIALFDMSNGSKSITLKYDNANVGTIFYAYFVCCPTSTNITSIVVKTDQSTYEKKTNTNVKFTTNVFQSIAVNMNSSDGFYEEVKDVQELSFSESELSYEIGGGKTFIEPVLDGAMTSPVSYFSKNRIVADVDPATGKVSFKSEGTVEICAVAPEDDTYYPALASYTITVTRSAPVEATYYEASSLEEGRSYIIVSNGKVLKNNNGTVSYESATVSGNSVTAEIGASVLWTMVDVNDSELNGYGDFQLINDSKYLSRISGSTSSSKLEIHSSSDEELSGKMKYAMWNYDGSYLYNISKGGNSTNNYYVEYSDGWNITTTKGNTKLYESRQPLASLSFSSDEAEYDLATSRWTKAVPTLNGASGKTVEYSSNNTSVATVANDGSVTPVAKGSAIITASVEGDDTYQGASARYTVKVIDSSQKGYEEVTDNTISSGKYLITSSGSSGIHVFSASASNNHYLVSDSDLEDGVIPSSTETDACAVEFKLVSTEDGDRYYISTAEGYVYVGKDGSSSAYKFQTEQPEDSKYAFEISFSSDGTAKISSKGDRSSSYYISYSSNKFSLSSSSSKVTLYKLQ